MIGDTHATSLASSGAPNHRTLAAFTLAGLLVACSNDVGSDDSATAVTTTTAATTTTTTSAPDLSAEEQAAFETEVEWTQCLRDNGIQGLPDPQVNEDGFILAGFPLLLPEKWNTAQEACQPIFDGAGPPGESVAKLRR